MSEDIEINEDCVVRPREDNLFELRVGEPNWHRNAALLDYAAACKLKNLLDDFVETCGRAE